MHCCWDIIVGQYIACGHREFSGHVASLGHAIWEVRVGQKKFSGHTHVGLAEGDCDGAAVGTADGDADATTSSGKMTSRNAAHQKHSSYATMETGGATGSDFTSSFSS